MKTDILLVITVGLMLLENVVIMFFMYIRLLRTDRSTSSHRSNLKE
jgi:hypothetical protein